MKNIEKHFVVPLTWPAGAGHPLPSGEGFTAKHFPIWTGLAYDRSNKSSARRDGPEHFGAVGMRQGERLVAVFAASRVARRSRPHSGHFSNAGHSSSDSMRAKPRGPNATAIAVHKLSRPAENA
jgi:hypothetical protein